MESTNPVAEPASVTKKHQGKDGRSGALAKPNPKRPLNFLDLFRDILELILDEITYTNDLTALALTHSSLYYLVVPRIYARFDIVWPDVTGASTEPKTVDALTYGLSTLTLGSRFASTTRKAYWPGGPASPAKFGGSGNSYARYIKKFSLGNGPPDWVAEYMICKEGGKMLGTLVALAVAKMKNLETFIWDMPTGVLSDVFMALSSLGDQPNGECRLNSVRVRWHNKLTEPDDPPPPPANLLIGPMGRPVLPPGSRMTPIGIMLPDTAAPPRPHSPYTYANYICEYPTLSVLPPLRSLTGLDIDELVYLDEMAILIERSKDLLKELRVGISIRAADRDFSQTWDGPDLKQMDPCARWPGASRIGQRRLGGVLGVIFSHIYDIRKQEGSIAEGKSSAANAVSGVLVPGQDDGAAPIQTGDAPPPLSPRPRERLAGQVQAPSALEVDRPASPGKGNTNGKLGLEILELERVSLSIHVLRYAIDWSILTRLTLLDCPQHEDLWKMLHKVFRPTATASGRRYHLALKKIHTDLTTVALLDFLRETLEPNTLEVLFLQDRRRGISPSVVPLNLVWRAINRHHSSLQMLLLDSSARSSDAGRWRAWCPNTSMMNWLTSGRMSSLTQLSIHLSYIDWHLFLQRLPNMHQLRALNIPRIADFPAPGYEPGEMVQQIADIITLRPEIRLCYVGLGPKCFEILDIRPPATFPRTLDPWHHASNADGAGEHDPQHHDASAGVPDVDEGDATDDDDESLEEDEDPDHPDEWEEEDQEENTPTTTTSDDDGQSEDLGDADDLSENTDWFDEPLGGFRLKLREILFYDEKVAIFKVRHGRL